MSIFLQLAATDPLYFFSWVIIVTFSICVHEYAHAVTALKLGDDTAAQAGHLTFNPLIQMGWQSLVALLVMGIAWGAVPVSPYLSTRKSALVSFAGPLSNIILCVVFALAAVVADKFSAGGPVIQFINMASVANAMLFVFNMLPIPMLDGWLVYALVIPGMNRIDRMQSGNLSWTLLLIVCVTPIIDAVWAAAGIIAGSVVGLWSSVFGLLV
ncbi:MAG: site-2 protease family protein [bacterium]